MAQLRAISLLFIILFYQTNIVSCNNIQPDVNNDNCPQTIMKLEALPGQGWDSIRNKEMGRVLDLSYTNCRTSEDRKYLIPDDIYVVALKDSNLQTTSEFFEHWLNYTSVVAASFKVNVGFNIFGLIGVQGSYDTSFLDAKSRQVGEKAMTTRIQVRNEMYMVQSPPSSKIDPGLKIVLDKVIECIDLNNFEKAELLCQIIVRDYGTHYISQAVAGAVLLEEDYVSSSFVSESGVNKLKISAAAGASFIKKFASAKFSFKVEQAFQDKYESMKTSSNIKSIGGSLISSNMSVDEWLKEIPNNLVVIDRSGSPLSFLPTPERFPNTSISTLNNVRKLLEKVIKDYYSYNTHKGCTDVNSINFDYNANIDNNMCTKPANNYSFGGGYINCTSTLTDAGDLCTDLNVKNPLSGQFRCEDGFEPIPLTKNTLEARKMVKEYYQKCSGWWLWKKCWTESRDVMKYSKSQYQGTWCISSNSPKNNTGVMFGGLYSSWMENPLTKDRSCPVAYMALTLAPDLKVCVSNAYDTGYQYSAPFGGFFSCQHGNPLTTRLQLYGKTDQYLHTCPNGYSQRMAIIDNGCEINYCVKLDSKVKQINVVLPPFRDQSAMYMVTDVLKSVGDNAEKVEDGDVSGLTIGIIVVGVLATLVIAIGGSVFIIKKRRRVSILASENESEREALINPTGYGTTNTNEPVYS